MKVSPALLAISLLISGAIFLFWFRTSGYCLSPERSIISSIHGTIFSPTEDLVAFAQYVHLYRKPIGICTFPDGGGSSTIESSVRIYTVPVAGGIPTLLASIPSPHLSYINHDGYYISGWDGNELYISVSFHTSSEIASKTFSVNTATGVASEITQSRFEQIQSVFYGQQMFSANNKNNWLAYDEKVGISLYSGGGRILDESNQTIGINGEPNSILRTIVDKQTLQNLLPPASEVQLIQSPGMF